MKRPTLTRALWWIAIVSATFAWCVPQSGTWSASPSLAVRFLGPFARPAARAQWVRVDLAVREGRTELALSRADLAIALDPTATAGFRYLASHLVFDRGSRSRSPDVAERRAWLEAGLAVARRGETMAAEPGELALWQGLVLSQAALDDPQLGGAEGAPGLWRAAATHFERALSLGQSSSGPLLEVARERARPQEH